ncbi:hypothetical protein K504DRAFT_454081 [Pleomassaria siparia CBS 279.74]|uniref:Uncharacterized protein n=1 Tax=Pleomassaria siparia CBS 279.74 TaxID=1314801 RepID=A0A6G1KF80_9PLEO|nr:hypothetical protein K504DRAFT_454081 [Pleomassaria siparia CBS 279.74]
MTPSDMPSATPSNSPSTPSPAASITMLPNSYQSPPDDQPPTTVQYISAVVNNEIEEERDIVRLAQGGDTNPTDGSNNKNLVMIEERVEETETNPKSTDDDLEVRNTTIPQQTKDFAAVHTELSNLDRIITAHKRSIEDIEKVGQTAPKFYRNRLVQLLQDRRECEKKLSNFGVANSEGDIKTDDDEDLPWARAYARRMFKLEIEIDSMNKRLKKAREVKELMRTSKAKSRTSLLIDICTAIEAMKSEELRLLKIGDISTADSMDGLEYEAWQLGNRRWTKLMEPVKQSPIVPAKNASTASSPIASVTDGNEQEQSIVVDVPNTDKEVVAAYHIAGVKAGKSIRGTWEEVPRTEPVEDTLNQEEVGVMEDPSALDLKATVRPEPPFQVVCHDLTVKEDDGTIMETQSSNEGSAYISSPPTAEASSHDTIDLPNSQSPDYPGTPETPNVSTENCSPFKPYTHIEDTDIPNLNLGPAFSPSKPFTAYKTEAELADPDWTPTSTREEVHSLPTCSIPEMDIGSPYPLPDPSLGDSGVKLEKTEDDLNEEPEDIGGLDLGELDPETVTEVSKEREYLNSYDIANVSFHNEGEQDSDSDGEDWGWLKDVEDEDLLPRESQKVSQPTRTEVDNAESTPPRKHLPHGTKVASLDYLRGPIRSTSHGNLAEEDTGDWLLLDPVAIENAGILAPVAKKNPCSTKHATTVKGIPEMKNGATAFDAPRSRKPISRIIYNYMTGSNRPTKESQKDVKERVDREYVKSVKNIYPEIDIKGFEVNGKLSAQAVQRIRDQAIKLDIQSALIENSQHAVAKKEKDGNA